jgi:hypothetical protein
MERDQEQRQSEREPFRVSVRATIYPPPGSETSAARTCHLLTQDLSPSGVSIVYALPFSIGQRIDLEMRDGKRSAVVRRIIGLSDGHYLAGCAFEP